MAVPSWETVFSQVSELIKTFGFFPEFERWRPYWDTLEIRRVGSTVTRLYVPGQSDVDLVFYFPERDALPREEQLDLLNLVSIRLREHFALRQGLERDVALIEAKAPIVQLRLGGLDVDISAQSLLGIANSSHISRYCEISPELRLLTRKVKEFAQAWGVKSGKDGTLSSFGYTLLCVHFLQNYCPARLPVLPLEGERQGAGRGENRDPNHPVDHGKRAGGSYAYFSNEELAAAVRSMQPRDITGKEPPAREVVLLFGHFAAWLLQLLESGKRWVNAETEQPYVCSIRTLDQDVAWAQVSQRLDRRAYLLVEEPFTGANLARPLTAAGAQKMEDGLRKACQQLQAHPLSRSLCLNSVLSEALQTQAWSYAHEHAYYNTDPGMTAHTQYGQWGMPA